MFCSKCGAEIDKSAKFCVKCGAQTGNTDNSKNSIGFNYVPQPMAELFSEQEKPKKKSNKILNIIALLVIILVLIGMIGGLMYYIFSKKSAPEEYSGYLKKAEECYEEDDLEGAVGYYLEALKLEEDDPDIYISLAEVYRKMGKPEKAEAILTTGYEVTKDAKIEQLLDELKEEFEAGKNGEEKDADDSEDEPEVYTGEKRKVNIEVRQVDASNFPEIVLYASITDEDGNTIEKMDQKDFNIQEIDAKGDVKDATINDVYQVLNQDNINVNLVLDASGSMGSYKKMDQAKNAASALIDQMELTSGDAVEIISFDDYVYLEQEFSSQSVALHDAINGIGTNGNTALYDALYAGLYQTYYETGAKCVIGFTDGMENASSYTFDDVVNMAQNTGIPVFIIGIGEEYDSAALQELADLCSGRYYSANVTDLEAILEDIYVSIYQEQQDYYVLKYTSDNLSDVDQFRDVVVETSEFTEFSGYYKKSYVPQADIYGAFSDSYMEQDFMIPDSDIRAVTETDLSQMSLAQLRIARNEIFARHGRQFKDSMLNQWFYSKVWYLNIPTKYAPDTFDALVPNPLTQLELSNANFIKQYEETLMIQQDIYPDAANTLLSDYDLALSKAVLKNAYKQIQSYSSTAILEENKRLILEAINKEDVSY